MLKGVNLLLKEKWLQEAIKLAQDNETSKNGSPFGAVVVKDGVIVGRGVNQVKRTHDPSQHAELQAVIHACQSLQTTDLTGCEIYASTEPCPMCLSAIYFTKIDAVYFAEISTESQDYVYHQLSLPRQERDIHMEQLLEKN